MALNAGDRSDRIPSVEARGDVATDPAKSGSPRSDGPKVVAMALTAIVGIVAITTLSHKGAVDADGAILMVVVTAALALGVPKGIDIFRAFFHQP